MQERGPDSDHVVYRIILYIDKNGKSEELEMFVTFKIKKFDIDSKACDMLIMTNVTTNLKLNLSRLNQEVLDKLHVGVAHDMQGPLNSIVTTIEMLLGIGHDDNINNLLKST